MHATLYAITACVIAIVVKFLRVPATAKLRDANSKLFLLDDLKPTIIVFGDSEEDSDGEETERGADGRRNINTVTDSCSIHLHHYQYSRLDFDKC